MNKIRRIDGLGRAVGRCDKMRCNLSKLQLNKDW